MNDSTERAREAVVERIVHDKHKGYDPDLAASPDGADFQGNFESFRYFDGNAADVRRWFGFQPAPTDRVRRRYARANLEERACLHLRFGDYTTFPWKLLFFTPSADYYRRAVELLNVNGLAVFSDDPSAARSRLRNLDIDILFVEGNADWEDLFLMTQCRSHVVSSSTFSWWGAWLAATPEKMVVRPAEGRFRPGSAPDNHDFYPPEWMPLPAIPNSISEKYWFLRTQHEALKAARLPARVCRRISRRLLRTPAG